MSHHLLRLHFESCTQEVAEEWQSMIQLHLFVVQCKAERYRAKKVVACRQSYHAPQGKPETDRVVSVLNLVKETSPNILLAWPEDSILSD